MSWQLDGRPLRRILVTRLRYLGDIAMATIVLAALRRGDPLVQLGFLCESEYAPLLAGHPLLATVHALAVKRGGADAAARRPARGGEQPQPEATGTAATVRQLRSQRYDLAVDLFFNPRSAWLLRLAAIPARIAGAPRGYRRLLYTHLAPSAARRPGFAAVAGGGLGEHLSRLAPLRRADGQPFFDWLAASGSMPRLRPMVPRPPLLPAVREALARLSADAAGYILLAPAATWPSKEWPLSRWGELAVALGGAGRKVLVLCPPGGAGRYSELAGAIPAGRGGLLPPLPLDAALAVVGAAALLVSVDGGIMHAAVAMQVPTVALFGPTDPALWFPYDDLGPYRILATRPACHPCHRHDCDAFICLPDLTAARVHAAVEALLAGIRS